MKSYFSYDEKGRKPFFVTVSIVLSFLLVVTLLPTYAFKLLGENTVQKAFADMESNSYQSNVVNFDVKQVGVDLESYFKANGDDVDDRQDTDRKDNVKESGEDKSNQYNSEELDEILNANNYSYSNAGVLATVQVGNQDPIDVYNDDFLRKTIYLAGSDPIVVNLQSDEKHGRYSVGNNQNVIINLHGHVWNRGRWNDSCDDGEIFWIGTNATLTINGASNEEEKAYEHKVNGFSNVDEKRASYSVKGGVICGGASENGSGGIHFGENHKNGTVYMNDTLLFGCESAPWSVFTWWRNGHGAGAVFEGSNNSLHMKNSSIQHCDAWNEGGVFYFCSGHHNNHVYMDNSDISYNYDDDWGAVVYDGAGGNAIYGDAVYGDWSHGSTIHDNKADQEAGFAYIWLDDASATIPVDNVSTFSGLNIVNNHADNEGGAIKIWEESLTCINCNIIGNTSGEEAGAIFLDDPCSLTNCWIERNTCKEKGNIYCEDSGSFFFNNADCLSLNGKIHIADNFRGNVEKDIYLNNAKVGPQEIWIVPSVTNDSLIGVDRSDISDQPYLVEESGSYNAECFFSNDDGYHIECNNSTNNRLKFVSGKKPRPEPWSPTEIAPIGIDDPEAKTELDYNGYDVFRYTTSYSIMTDSDDYLSCYYYYSDGFFDEDPKIYNDHLASLSMTGEISCSKQNEDLSDGTGQLDYSKKLTNVAQFFANVGCNQQDIYVNDNYLKQPTRDSIGCAIASKQLTLKDADGNEDNSYILMPIVVRGMGYEAEWASNFNVGNSGNHNGFQSAANQVIASIQQYILSFNLQDKANDGKIKFWIMGHSRAGATTNLTAKQLTDDYGDEGNKIYAYAFEPPLCVDSTNPKIVDKDYTYNGTYANIHNVINGADPVVHIPYMNMSGKNEGFTRYGVSHYLPGTAPGDIHKDPTGTLPDNFDNDFIDTKFYDDSSEYVAIRNEMKKQYKAVNAYELYQDFFQARYWHGGSSSGIDAIDLVKIFVTDGNVAENQKSSVKYCKDFVKQLFEWTFERRVYGSTLRDRYVYEHDALTSGKKESFQSGISNILGILMGKNPRVFSELTGNLLPILLGGDWFGLLWDMIWDWWDEDEPFDDEGMKWLSKNLTDYIMAKRDVLDLSDFLTDTERAEVKESLYVILFLLLRFFVVDDCFDDSKDLDWGLGELDRGAIIKTAMNNIMTMFINHYPECSLAWVRAYDDWYDGNNNAQDLECVKVTKAKSPEPNTVKLRYEGNTYYSERQDVVLTGSNNFQLFTSEINGATNDGEVIYYNLKETDNPSEVESPGDNEHPEKTAFATHYQGKIILQSKAPETINLTNYADVNEEGDTTTYYLKAVSVGYLKFSQVSTFKIIVNNGNVVTIHSMAYDDVDGRTIYQRVVKNSNVVFGTESNYHGARFKQWHAYVSDTKDPTSERTEQIFTGEGDACNQNINVTWFKMWDQDLWLEAEYDSVYTVEINLKDDNNFKMNYGQTLPTQVEPSYIFSYISGDRYVSPFTEVGITWIVVEENGNEKIIEDANDTVKPGKGYKFELNINLDKTNDFVLMDNINKITLKWNGQKIETNNTTTKIDCDYTLDTPVWKLTHTYSKNVVVSQQKYPETVEVENQYDKEAPEIYESIKDKLPESINVVTNRGEASAPIGFDENKLTEKLTELGNHEDEFQLEPINYSEICSDDCKQLPDYMLDASGNKIDINVTISIKAKAKNPVNLPYADIAPGTYESPEGVPVEIHLNNEYNLPMKYGFTDNLAVAPTTWFDYNPANPNDKISLSPENKNFYIWAYTFTVANQNSFNEKECTQLSYRINIKENGCEGKISYINDFDSQKREITQSKTISFDAWSNVTFRIENVPGYEFQCWTEDTHGQTPLITDDNKYLPELRVVGFRNFDIKAIYVPIIQEIDIEVDKPIVGTEMLTNIKSIKIISPYETTICTTPTQIQQILDFKWVYAYGEYPSEEVESMKGQYNTQYLASVDIHKEYFANKGLVFSPYTSVKVIDPTATYKTRQQMISGKYALYNTEENDSYQAIDTYHINILPPITPKPKLLWTDSFPDVSGIPVYTSLEDIVNDYLQKEVSIVVEGASVDKASVRWMTDEEEISYNPENWDEQEFIIKGEIRIPSYIDNGTKEEPLVQVIKPCKVSVDGKERAASPIASPNSGVFRQTEEIVTLSTTEKDSTIFYRLTTEPYVPPEPNYNGANEVEFIEYTGPITLTTVKQTKTKYTIECYTEHNKEGKGQKRPSLHETYTFTLDMIYVPCTEVVMDPSYIDVEVYSDFVIGATPMPDGPEGEETWDTNLNWSSSDDSKVGVRDKGGICEAFRVGECEVYAVTQLDQVTGVTKVRVHGLTYGFLENPNDSYVLKTNKQRQYIVGAESNRFTGITIDGVALDRSAYDFILIPLPDPEEDPEESDTPDLFNLSWLFGGDDPEPEPVPKPDPEPPYNPDIDTQTVVRILPQYLEKLGVGNHEITFNFNDGSATTQMRVVNPLTYNAAASDNPIEQTDDAINDSQTEVQWWLIMLIAFVLVAGASLVTWRVLKARKRGGHVKK